MAEKVKVYDPNYITDDAIYFYTPRFYAFDNFSSFSINIWGRTFPTVEHAYQWRKYSESAPDIAEEIFIATSPNAVKKISDAHKVDIDHSWHDEKVERMEQILLAKLVQHDKVRKLLTETGDKEIIENSPIDYFWGIGEDGTGKNMMGKIWMKLRAELNK